MAFDDAALERALRAETKHGLTLYCNGETLTALGYEWMAVVPMDGLRERLRGTLGALVEMLGYIPENDTVRIVRNKGGYLVQPELRRRSARRSTAMPEKQTPRRSVRPGCGWG